VVLEPAYKICRIRQGIGKRKAVPQVTSDFFIVRQFRKPLLVFIPEMA
jgi:hypothetical protein